MVENLWVTELGVEVEDIPMSHLYGAYIHQHGLILLNNRLPPIQRRSTPMHELGHVFYGDTESTARTECEAFEWAARQLIPCCEFARLSKLYDNPVAVASELGVLPREVENYVGWLQRLELLKMA